MPATDPIRINAFLDAACADPGLHARFLNTLSLMEHIGSRKIMVSQSRRPLGQETLKHLAEEARHAFFFKRAADAAARREMSYDDVDVIAGPRARLYMGRLDAFIGHAVSGEAAYLYMSLTIEIRAIWFYRLYQDALKRNGHGLNLNSLLAEETRHLDEMRRRLVALDENPDARLPVFVAYEEALFGNLLTGLEQGVAATTLV
ncbi:MAG: hypothetical protein BGN82_08640 [Alphaproteobacteria bacterium 65-7]|nr:MAG: hypothetical protein BGN82_08640 [Alphaproteobacteria bacterium 65-7]